MNVGSSVSYKRGEGETTEWDDILRKKGIIGPSEAELKRQAAEELEKAAEEAKERIDPLAFKSVAELDELEEDDAEFGDSRALDEYRQKRLAEMKAAAARARFGTVQPLSRVDFVREVNEASSDGTWVVVHLHQDHVPDSVFLARALAVLARRQPEVKFLVIKADSCVEDYPDRNVPTLLLYCEGSCKGQVVGLGEMAGQRVNADVVEWVLHKRGVCKTELEDDPREDLMRSRGAAAAGGGTAGMLGFRTGGGSRRRGSEDEDDE